MAVRPGCPAGTAGAVLGALCPPAPGRGAGAGPGHRDRPGQGVGQGGTSSLFIVGSAFAQRQRQAFRPPFPVHQLPERPLGLFLLTLLGLTLWLVRKPVRVLARTGEVFYLALAIGLGFSLPPGRTPGGAPAHPSPVDGGSSGGALRRRSGAGPVRLCGLCRLPGGMSPGERETAAVRYGGRPPSVWCLPPFSLSAWATSGPG